MRNWIANLIRQLRRPASTEENLPCVYSAADDNIRVDVLEHLLPCGHCAYSIRGECYIEELRDWIKIVDLRDYNAETAIKLTSRAARFVVSMEQSLVTTR